MDNAYGLDADYFIRLFARELSPDVVRNQTPACLARVLLRAARTASEQVFAELEFSDLFPKPAEALTGITLSAEGEANTYRMMRGGNWLASIRMNGELLVSQQEAILSAMLASPPADHSAHGLNMVGALVTALDGLLSITQDSAGVAGYHLNGEIAEWGEFPEVDTAHEALSLYREQPSTAPAADLHVWRATTKFGHTCHFGEASCAKAWAGQDGKIERVDLKPAPDLQVVEQADQPSAASVPAGCKVVPVELLERLEHVTRTLVPHLQCHVDLRALLASAEGGE